MVATEYIFQVSLMENLTPWATLTLVFAGALFLISKITHKKQSAQKHPPGPTPWPLIGNLNLFSSDIPHKFLHNLSQQYGGIMQLKFGNKVVVIVSSPDMAKEFLKTHDQAFASRPANASGKYISYNYSDMAWAPYGAYWRQAREIFRIHVFNPEKQRSFAHILIDERRQFLSRLNSISGRPVVLKDHLCHYMLSTMSRMVLGNKYFGESKQEKGVIYTLEELQTMLYEWFSLHGAFNIADWVPWLSRFDVQGYVKRMMLLSDKFDKFLNFVIDDHLAKRATEKDYIPTDLADILLHLVEDNSDQKVKLTRDCVKGLLQDLLAGGTETAATTLEWAVQEMTKQPRIIEKAKEELENVAGKTRWIEDNDFSQLPYLDAIIMETLRLHATILAPHCAMEDRNVAGYNISKGTTVLINVWSIGRDPNSWDMPEEFIPERFVGGNIDMFGSNFALLPFGSGRRMCPGYKLGLDLIRTILANLLHGFNWKLPVGQKPQDVSLEEHYGFTIHPKVPVSIILEPTLPKYLY